MDDKPKLTIVKSGNLSEGAQFWNDITAQHSLNEIELQILRTICTTMNLCEQFRRSLAEDGLVFTTVAAYRPRSIRVSTPR